MSFNRKNHWDNIYQTKKLEDVSWYQKTPKISLEFIKKSQLNISSGIIDIGGGDSFLVDNLIRLGYEDITVLDISQTSIVRAKKRLGKVAEKVQWVVSDITQFEPERTYDLWYDRAAFHFLSDNNEINNYISIAHKSLSQRGIAIIGTFSLEGPQKCSGIEVMQYSAQSLSDKLQPKFKKIECQSVEHLTPFNTLQHFTFCRFHKLKTVL